MEKLIEGKLERVVGDERGGQGGTPDGRNWYGAYRRRSGGGGGLNRPELGGKTTRGPLVDES